MHGCHGFPILDLIQTERQREPPGQLLSNTQLNVVNILPKTQLYIVKLLSNIQLYIVTFCQTQNYIS